MKYEKYKLNITESIVKKKLLELDINKACGPDQIHTHLLKETSNKWRKPLSIIMNKSLIMKCPPKEWKKQIYQLYIKKRVNKMASNYKPVSLTSVVCKTMEKIVRDNVSNFMNKNSLFSYKQYGFLQKRYTVLKLFDIIDQWSIAMDEGYEINCFVS